MNAINVIAPYKYEGMWVFDDARVGLLQEPFVSGADTMIDQVVSSLPDPDAGFLMTFSAHPFPGFMAKLVWVRAEFGGNWYRWEESGMEGWLCPALFKYFETAPAEIFVKVEARKGP